MRFLAAVALLVVGACSPTSYYENPLYAEGKWTRAFAANGCEQPTEGLVERIAATPGFGDASLGDFTANTRPGSPERASYMTAVSVAYYRDAKANGFVSVSEDGSRARLLIGPCRA